MAAITSIEALETAMVARIVALDGAAYNQGALDATWRESAQALNPDSQPTPTAHLAFAVWASSVPVEEYSSDCLRGTATISMRFLYRLRSGDQSTDMRKASSAAQQLVTSLRAGFEGVPVSVVDAGSKSPITGGWLAVDLEFDAMIKISAVA